MKNFFIRLSLTLILANNQSVQAMNYLNIQNKKKSILPVKEVPFEAITFQELTKNEQTIAISPHGRFFTTCLQGQNFHIWSLFNMNPYPQTSPYLYVQKLDPSNSSSLPTKIDSLFPGNDPLVLGLDNAYPKIPEMHNIINQAVSLISFSQAEDIFACATQNKKIFLQYGTQQQHLYTTHAKITALEFSHDHQLFAIELKDATILLFKSIKTLSLNIIDLIARLTHNHLLTRDQLREEEQVVYDPIPPPPTPSIKQI